MKENETYESLQEYFKEQKKLIEEGKIQKPQVIYGFSPEGRREFDKGITAEVIMNNWKKKNKI